MSQPDSSGQHKVERVTLRKRILVVDDEQIIREMIQMMLDGDDYEVVEAENGPTALAAARSTMPDLILLDMNKPVMGGGMFAQAYADIAGPHAPIVVCTAAVDTKLRANQRHAASFLAKPFSIRDLRATVVSFAA
jgi:two-component system, NtrC family, nitrogen regulation response regulator NtrX